MRHLQLPLLALLLARASAFNAAFRRLLLQRSVQTQIVYLTDFHDEVKATWLGEYGSPAAPLGTVRLSNTECLPKYHGLDAFSSVDATQYLRDMLLEEPFVYAVRYKVGTAPGHGPGNGADEGDGFGTGNADDGSGAFGDDEAAAAAAFKSGVDMWAAETSTKKAPPAAEAAPPAAEANPAKAAKAAKAAEALGVMSHFDTTAGAFAGKDAAKKPTSTSSAPAWGNAAASRRRNPYLKNEARYIEYDETVVPARVAQLLFQVQSQIAQEWSRDLLAIAAGTIEPDLPANGQELDEREMLARVQSAYAKVVRENALAADEGIGTSDSSPLRAANLDLCERLATREAALALLAEGSLPRGAARRLEAKLQFSEADVDPTPPDDEDDNEFLALNRALKQRAKELNRVDALGGHARRRGLARRWLEDLERSDEQGDQAVASLVRRKRAELARTWANSCVEDLAAEHALLLREALEQQLRSGPADGAPGPYDGRES